MIYEKRTDSSQQIADSVNDCCMPASWDKSLTVYQKNEPVTTAADNSVSFTKNKKTHFRLSRLRTRKRRFSVLMAATCLLTCLFFIDTRFLGGNIKTHLVSEINRVFNSESNNTLYFAEIPSRTIYTLQYYTPVPPAVQNISAADISFSQISSDAKASSETAVAATSSVSASSLDGTAFYPITTLDLSTKSPLILSNGTKFNVDTQKLLSKTPSSLEALDVGTQPLVLILHTHACESYSEHVGTYPQDSPTRSENVSKNVVRIGEEIARSLSDFGISAIHCKTLHDKDSFINAYTESAKSVKQYLKEYPSIQFVIDVHRDAIIRDSGESIKAISSFAGEDYAQIMFVVGTNELGHNHPDWNNNLSLALTLQESISNTYPNLCRSINLRNVPFNQQLSDGYLLLEVGTSANTLEEALRSARVFGQEFAKVIKQSA